MEISMVVKALGILGEAGIFGLGWIGFLWAMLQLKYERARYQTLVVHIIEYFTKVNFLREIDHDLESDSAEQRPDSLRSINGPLGRIFGREDDGRARPKPRGRRGEGEG